MGTFSRAAPTRREHLRPARVLAIAALVAAAKPSVVLRCQAPSGVSTPLAEHPRPDFQREAW
ncbi:MAG TPA: hypothetical protein VM736_06850, partial [Gemmatimonadales bacterium]|nr:hypothetical protein [Gemmatimonadales bacterium]